MDSFDLFLAVLVSGVVGFQGWLTAQVWKSDLYDRRQKILQAQLIWLLPVLGSGLVFTMLRDDLPADRGAHTRDRG